MGRVANYEQSIKNKIVRCLRKAGKPLTVCDIAASLGISKEVVYGALTAVNHRYFPGLVVSSDKPHTYHLAPGNNTSFALPENLFRGWYNVLLGVQPEKLGL